MTHYSTWKLLEDTAGCGDSPLLLREYCATCSDMTWHEPSHVRQDTRSKAPTADLCALLWCCRCKGLKPCFKADFVPPLPFGFEVRDERIVRQSP